MKTMIARAFRLRGFLVAAVLVAAVHPFLAQEKPAAPEPAPAVTDLMQAQFQAAGATKEVWALKLYQAGVEYQRASEAADKLVAGWQKPGYDLRLAADGKTLEYVARPKDPDPVKTGGTPK